MVDAIRSSSNHPSSTWCSTATPFGVDLPPLIVEVASIIRLKSSYSVATSGVDSPPSHRHHSSMVDIHLVLIKPPVIDVVVDSRHHSVCTHHSSSRSSVSGSSYTFNSIWCWFTTRPVDKKWARSTSIWCSFTNPSSTSKWMEDRREVWSERLLFGNGRE